MFFKWATMIKEIIKGIKLNKKNINKIFESTPLAVAVFESGVQNKHFINYQWENLFGYNKKEFFELGFDKITDPKDLKREKQLLLELKEGSSDFFNLEKRVYKKNKEILWVALTTFVIERREDSFTYIMIAEDITKRKTAEKKLKESERSRKVITDNLMGVVYRCRPDKDWTMEYLSKRIFDLTGYPASDFILNEKRSFESIIAPIWKAKIRTELTNAISKGKNFKEEYQLIAKNKEIKWVYDLGEGVFDDDGKLVAIEGILIDISEQKKYRSQLEYNAEHDLLTNLYNRQKFHQIFNNYDHQQEKNALFVISLLEFAPFIVSHGLAYYNKMFKEISDSLVKLTNQEILLFRNHEFGLTFYFRNYQDKENLIAFYDKIKSILNKHLANGLTKVGLGIVKLLKNDSLEGALKNGLIAANRTLLFSNELISFAFFDEKMAREIERENILKEEFLELAKTSDDLGLYLNYQPIIFSKNGEVVGFETLARYQSSNFGYISPLEMIPLIEKSHLINEIGYKIISQALTFLKKISVFKKDLFLSLNLSILQLLDAEFLEKIKFLVKEKKVDPKNIVFEITESSYLLNISTIKALTKNINDLGIEFAIDDFGVGYSSFHRLSEINFKYLKIDKSFTKKLLLPNQKATILIDIISMSHKLNKYVIVEGVEEQIEVETLKEIGCDYLQGFYYSKPLSDLEALNYLRKTKHLKKN